MTHSSAHRSDAAGPETLNVFWFLPTHGDGHYLGTAEGGRAVDLSYLQQVAQAADRLGYYGVLIPTGRSCEDSWVVASALAPLTQRLRFLVAVRPGLQSPTLAARMTATLDRLSNGRLLINIVSGGDPIENRGDGLYLDHAERYELTDEFLYVFKALLAGDEVTFHGRRVSVDGARILYPPVQQPRPPLFFGGSSEAANKVAAKSIDKYLTWGEPPRQVAEKIALIRSLAAAEGREVTFGIRLHVIVRETAEAAWQAAESLIRHVDDRAIAQAQAVFARMDSEGQRRMSALHQGRRENLEVSPNLWAGVGLVRGGAGTALVGDAKTVAARIEEYRALGVDSFILSGYPHLEEAYRFSELVMPLLPLAEKAGRQKPAANMGPFGETIANFNRPGSRLVSQS